MGYCMTCGETYRSSLGFFTCDLCKERKLNEKIFNLPITNFELLRQIRKNNFVVREIKKRLISKSRKEKK